MESSLLELQSVVKDLSKCHCEKAGFCPIFNLEMGISPPNFLWCQSATEEQRKTFFQNNQKVVKNVKERPNFAPVVNFYDKLPEKKSNFAVCVIPANDSAAELLDISRESIKSYAEKCGADYIELSGNQCEEWPIGNKFRLYEVSSTYDKTVFFDCDVIVKEETPDLFKITPNDKISAYDEYHDWSDKKWIVEQYRLINKGFDRPPDANIPRFMINSGVLVIPKSCCEYYKQPDVPYPKIWCFDQQYLSMVIPDDKFFRLDRRWNNCFATVDFWDFIENSFIFHINGVKEGDANFAPNARQSLMEYFRDTPRPTEYGCKTRNMGLPDSYNLPHNMDEVEIITYHYNLTQSKNLTRTYKTWIRSLKNIAPHIKCYEVVFDDREPEIDGSIVIRADSKKNCMWQKESLMNLAIKNIPDHKKYFFWIDHDQCYASPNWLNECVEKINNGFDFVQLFKMNHYLDKTHSILDSSYSRAYVCHTQDNKGSRNRRGAPGLGWACNTNSLKKITPLPNTMIGSGDEWLAAGLLRQIDFYIYVEGGIGHKEVWHNNKYKNARELSKYAKVTRDHIVKHIKMTMEKYFNTSYCTADSFHLWHGDFSNRQYLSRYEIISDCKIDIEKDIFVNEDGLLEFKEYKLDASKRLYKYFLDRKEDS